MTCLGKKFNPICQEISHFQYPSPPKPICQNNYPLYNSLICFYFWLFHNVFVKKLLFFIRAVFIIFSILSKPSGQNCNYLKVTLYSIHCTFCRWVSLLILAVFTIKTIELQIKKPLEEKSSENVVSEQKIFNFKFMLVW